MSKIVAIDASGTHITVGVKQNAKLQVKRVYTKDIKSITEIIPSNTTKLCIGASAVIHGNSFTLSNADFTIRKKELPKQHTVVNDFELYVYALNTKTKFTKIRGTPKKENAIVLGAGTGLGFCFAEYKNGTYYPRATESGETYASIDELNFLKFLQDKLKTQPRYEDILSGRGILFLTEFYAPKTYAKTKTVQTTNEAVKIVMKKPPKKVLEKLAKYYARFINHASYFLPWGGIYITGGIAQKNPELFSHSAFIKELNTLQKDKPELAKMPILLMTEYEASIKGGIWAAENL